MEAISWSSAYNVSWISNMIKHIIIPKQNEKDLDEIPTYIKKGITFHPVSRMEEVIETVF